MFLYVFKSTQEKKTKQPKYMKIRAGKRNAEMLEEGLEREQMQETENWPVKEGQHVYRMLTGDRWK